MEGPPPNQAAPAFAPTITILFSDIRGFTEYTQSFGDEPAYQMLQRHNALMREQLTLYRGHAVKTQGDSFMVSFKSGRTAIRCAIAIQKAVKEAIGSRGDSTMQIGIGINTGEPVREGSDFIGGMVNLAARICAVAEPGQILISETVRAVIGKMEGCVYVDRGTFDLKGFSEPQRLYEVDWFGRAAAVAGDLPPQVSPTSASPDIPPLAPAAPAATVAPKRVRKPRTVAAPAAAIEPTPPPPLATGERDLPGKRGGVDVYELVWSSGLTKVGALARRELSSYFVSPIGYVIAALMVPLVSLFAFLPAVLSGTPVAMDRVYGGLAYLLAFMAPFFTMRLLAEERRSGTLELLLTAPLRDWEVVLGKWLGALLFFIAITAFLFLFAAVIMYYEPTHQVISVAGISLSVGNLDLGPTFTGYLGVLMEAAALLALGLLCSSLTQNQILAAFVGLVITLSLVWLLGLGSFLPAPLSDIAVYMSAYDHFASFNQGRIVLRDLVYFLSVTAGALFLTVRVLESRRWR